MLPVREYLGLALLKAGLYAKAVTIFKKDLKENSNNHWYLKRLYQSLQKKINEQLQAS